VAAAAGEHIKCKSFGDKALLLAFRPWCLSHLCRKRTLKPDFLVTQKSASLTKTNFVSLHSLGQRVFGGRRILVSVQPLPERCGGIQTIGAFSVSLTGSGLGRCGDYLPFACRTTRRLVATAEENGTLAEDAVLARRRLRDGCRCQAAMMSGLDVEADRQVGLPRRYYQLFRVVRGEPWAA
jgi:hypothetical protein